MSGLERFYQYVILYHAYVDNHPCTLWYCHWHVKVTSNLPINETKVRIHGIPSFFNIIIGKYHCGINISPFTHIYTNSHGHSWKLHLYISLLFMIVNTASHYHTISTGTEAGNMHEACRLPISGNAPPLQRYYTIGPHILYTYPHNHIGLRDHQYRSSPTPQRKLPVLLREYTTPLLGHHQGYGRNWNLWHRV